MWCPCAAVTLHYVKVSNKDGVKRPELLLVHGTGGSSASWFPVLDGLVQHFNVYVLDLPGFGRDSLDGIQHLPAEDVISFYCDFISKFYEQADIKQVCWCCAAAAAVAVRVLLLAWPLTSLPMCLAGRCYCSLLWRILGCQVCSAAS